jgi:hypothetical protein
MYNLHNNIQEIINNGDVVEAYEILHGQLIRDFRKYKNKVNSKEQLTDIVGQIGEDTIGCGINDFRI